jgi:hypothetical protein
MVVRLSSSRQNTWGLLGNSNAKPVATPHRRITVLVKQATRRFHRKLGRARKLVHKQLPLNVYATSVNRRSEILLVEEWRGVALIYIVLEYNKKFSRKRLRRAGNRSRLDLVEELGRIKPRTVSELMEVANGFADGEDVYNNKRA